jgi:hypothetical protein
LLGLPVGDIMAGYESRARRRRRPCTAAGRRAAAHGCPAVSNLPWTPIVGTLAVAVLVLGVLWWKPWQQRGAAPIVERTARDPAAQHRGCGRNESAEARDSAVTSRSSRTAPATPAPPARRRRHGGTRRRRRRPQRAGPRPRVGRDVAAGMAARACA